MRTIKVFEGRAVRGLVAGLTAVGALGFALVAAHDASAAVGAADTAHTAHTAHAGARVAAKVTAKNFTVDFVAGDCAAGAECVATLKLEALGEFHINDNYPYKFRAQDAPGVAFLGKDAAGKNVFSKQAGDFRKDGAKAASLTVRFRPSKAGTLALAGQYKLSICSAQTCQLEAQDVAVDIVVK